jgi:hypothetical protein|uniref:Probable membrane transporter protein n=1 Tax=Desulfobacca acetoxidans TaxID=60893 RepID=A0A7C3UZG5_9BACT
MHHNLPHPALQLNVFYKNPKNEKDIMFLFLALFAAGLGAGILGALLGLGGGIFLVPALTLLFHLPIRAAVGTSLVGVIATSAAVVAMEPPGRGADISLALRLEVATAAGAVTGGWMAGLVPSAFLSLLFALVVFLTAGYSLYKGFKGRSRAGLSDPEPLFAENYLPCHWPLGLTVAFLAGLISGLLGVGGGFIKVPVMNAIMAVPLGVATATSNFMVGITAAASFFVYYNRGDIYPLLAVPTCLGVMLGAMLGVRLMIYFRAAWLRLALVALMIVMGIHMVLQGLGY